MLIYLHNAVASALIFAVLPLLLADFISRSTLWGLKKSHHFFNAQARIPINALYAVLLLAYGILYLLRDDVSVWGKVLVTVFVGFAVFVEAYGIIDLMDRVENLRNSHAMDVFYYRKALEWLEANDHDAEGSITQAWMIIERHYPGGISAFQTNNILRAYGESKVREEAARARDAGD